MDFTNAKVLDICEYIYTHGNHKYVVERLYKENKITYVQYCAVCNLMPIYDKEKSNAARRNSTHDAPTL